ncbi:hypothetical protein BLAT2472_10922 [Burkholderia latens]
MCINPEREASVRVRAANGSAGRHLRRFMSRAIRYIACRLNCANDIYRPGPRHYSD